MKIWDSSWWIFLKLKSKRRIITRIIVIISIVFKVDIPTQIIAHKYWANYKSSVTEPFLTVFDKVKCFDF